MLDPMLAIAAAWVANWWASQNNSWPPMVEILCLSPRHLGPTLYSILSNLHRWTTIARCLFLLDGPSVWPARRVACAASPASLMMVVVVEGMTVAARDGCLEDTLMFLLLVGDSLQNCVAHCYWQRWPTGQHNSMPPFSTSFRMRFSNVLGVIERGGRLLNAGSVAAP